MNATETSECLLINIPFDIFYKYSRIEIVVNKNPPYFIMILTFAYYLDKGLP